MFEDSKRIVHKRIEKLVNNELDKMFSVGDQDICGFMKNLESRIGDILNDTESKYNETITEQEINNVLYESFKSIINEYDMEGIHE